MWHAWHMCHMLSTIAIEEGQLSATTRVVTREITILPYKDVSRNFWTGHLE
jgi:hypothetical protein